MKQKRSAFRAVIAVLLLLAIGIGVFFLGYHYLMREMYPLKYSELIEPAAEENGLPKSLVYALVKAESDFEPEAESYAGARGLMQLMPETFEWLQIATDGEVLHDAEALYNPEINVSYGCRLLKMLIDQYGENELALCAYNAGSGTVEHWLEEYSEDGETLTEIPYPETENYVSAIEKNRAAYEQLYQFENGKE